MLTDKSMFPAKPTHRIEVNHPEFDKPPDFFNMKDNEIYASIETTHGLLKHITKKSCKVSAG